MPINYSDVLSRNIRMREAQREKLNKEMGHKMFQTTPLAMQLGGYVKDVVTGQIAKRGMENFADISTRAQQGDESAQREFMTLLSGMGAGMTKIKNLYHASPVSGLKTLKPSKEGLMGPGVYTTKNPEQAKKYGENLYKVSVTTKKPIDASQISKKDASAISKQLNGWLVDDYKSAYDNWLHINREFGPDVATKVFRDAGFDALMHKTYVIPFSGNQVILDSMGAGTIGKLKKSLDSMGVDHSLFERNGVINLSKIALPKGERGLGKGSKAMNAILEHADETGQRIELSPSVDFGGSSVERLKKFYKKFGFVENKGKNRDFSISESMYRKPEPIK